MNTTEQDSCGSNNCNLVVSLPLCTGCDVVIPAARLRAKPDATLCVTCLERSGDVKLVRRYDEFVGEELVSSFFTHNSYIESNLKRELHYRPHLVESEDLDRLQTLTISSVIEAEDFLIDALTHTVQ